MSGVRYSYDRRSRGESGRILKDLSRFIKMRMARAWRIHAVSDRKFSEYVLTADGEGAYSLASSGRQVVIPLTKDIGKLVRYLSNYEELDWDPIKTKQPEPGSGWLGLWT